METMHMLCLLANVLVLLYTTYAQDDHDSLTLQLLSRVEALEKHDAELKHTIAKQQQQLDQQTNKLIEQTNTIQRYIQQVDKLNVKVIELNVKVTDQQADLDQQNARFLNQEKRITHLEHKVKHHESMLSVLKMEGSTEKVTDEQFQINEGPLYDVNRTHEKDSNHQMNLKKPQPKEKPRPSRFVTAAEGPVAFHAVIARGEVANIGIGQNIKFDVVETNLGGGYHNQHGIFIAPQSGLYIISTSILSYNNAHSFVQVDLKKNGNVLARTYSHGDSGHHDQGSVTVVSQLKVGDEIWVSLNAPADDSIYGGYFTSFMGCLIMPM